MSAMDHAAAHDRIEDLLLEPALLDALESSVAPEDVALRGHLATCGACRADLETGRRLRRAVASALPRDAALAAAAVEPIDAPAELRARVLAAARADRGPRRDSPRAGWLSRIRPRFAAVAMAALVLAVVAEAGLVLDQSGRRATAESQARALASAIGAVDRVLAEPGHRVAALRAPDGGAGGSISWTRRDLVVLATALPEPRPGEVYRCWLNSGGSGWAVGRMDFALGTAYWVGTLDEWAAFDIGPDTLFRVSLEPPGADPAARSGPIVLEAALGT